MDYEAMDIEKALHSAQEETQEAETERRKVTVAFWAALVLTYFVPAAHALAQTKWPVSRLVSADCFSAVIFLSWLTHCLLAMEAEKQWKRQALASVAAPLKFYLMVYCVNHPVQTDVTGDVTGLALPVAGCAALVGVAGGVCDSRRRHSMKPPAWLGNNTLPCLLAIMLAQAVPCGLYKSLPRHGTAVLVAAVVATKVLSGLGMAAVGAYGLRQSGMAAWLLVLELAWATTLPVVAKNEYVVVVGYLLVVAALQLAHACATVSSFVCRSRGAGVMGVDQ